MLLLFRCLVSVAAFDVYKHAYVWVVFVVVRCCGCGLYAVVCYLPFVLDDVRSCFVVFVCFWFRSLFLSSVVGAAYRLSFMGVSCSCVSLVDV